LIVSENNRDGGKVAGKEVYGMLVKSKPKGQGIVEYALIIVLVAAIVIVVISLLGPKIGQAFSDVIAML
jgi:pilus assembly protein Flp/PilA